MTTLGTVRTWSDDDGWGVIDSAKTSGGCWTHDSSVLIDGPAPQPGQAVSLEWELADQDEPQPGTDAYGSGLMLRLDA